MALKELISNHKHIPKEKFGHLNGNSLNGFKYNTGSINGHMTYERVGSTLGFYRKILLSEENPSPLLPQSLSLIDEIASLYNIEPPRDGLTNSKDHWCNYLMSKGIKFGPDQILVSILKDLIPTTKKDRRKKIKLAELAKSVSVKGLLPEHK